MIMTYLSSRWNITRKYGCIGNDDGNQGWKWVGGHLPAPTDPKQEGRGKRAFYEVQSQAAQYLKSISTMIARIGWESKKRIGGAIKCLWRRNHGPKGVWTPVSKNTNEYFDFEIWTWCWFHIVGIWISILLKVTSKLPYFKWEQSKRRLKRKYICGKKSFQTLLSARRTPMHNGLRVEIEGIWHVEK